MSLFATPRHISRKRSLASRPFRSLRILAVALDLMVGQTACSTHLARHTPASVADIEGHSYQSIQVGARVWTRENLRTTVGRDGQPLTTFTPNDDSRTIAEFGRLYDWESARMVCPAGWTLPSEDDWRLLDRAVSEGRLRLHNSTPTPGRSAPRDQTAFGVRFAGYASEGAFDSLFGTTAVFWTASPAGLGLAWSRVVTVGQNSLRPATQHTHYGFSVRCIRVN